MGYRKCPNHGWLRTSEYTVDLTGETICPLCRNYTTGFQMDEPRSYSYTPGIQEALTEYNEWKDEQRNE